jgi:DNA-directed RNA polymerase alpha subunit
MLFVVYNYLLIQVDNTGLLIIPNFGRKPLCEISNSAYYLSDNLVKIVVLNIPQEDLLWV